MTERIMVTVGPSAISLKVVEFADAMALENESELLILHVVERSPYYQNTKVEFEKFMESIDLKSKITIQTPTGYPPTEIVDQIDKYRPDLVIMAGHSHNVLERVFLGSTVKYVVHHTNCPIYIFKEPLFPGNTPILVPVDFTRINKKVIQLADKKASKQGVELHLIHVIPDLGEYSDWGAEGFNSSGENYTTRQEEQVVKLYPKLDEYISNLNLNSVWKIYVREGTVYSQVLALQKELKCNLIMLASHSHNIIGRMLIGGNSDYILNHADCSVYVHQEGSESST